ncbi:hypothetical protein ACPYO6_13270 [Georgenia sp. Z1344]|uniref:hypothetical protein n=1 Tax=Georgenia sp. Z1344 TaxID=3416706 RepID=UPI003CFB23AA
MAGAAGAALLLAACGGGDGGGEEGNASGSSMRLALNQTEDHPSYVALDNFGTYLEENTDGWDIEVFPN